MSNLNETVNLIEEWGSKRGLDKIENNDKQLLKTVEEVGELAEAHNKNYPDKVIDSVGDIFVTLVLYCMQRNISITDCINEAYQTIARREGKTINGVFIKKEDL